MQLRRSPEHLERKARDLEVRAVTDQSRWFGFDMLELRAADLRVVAAERLPEGGDKREELLRDALIMYQLMSERIPREPAPETWVGRRLQRRKLGEIGKEIDRIQGMGVTLPESMALPLFDAARG